MFSEKVARGLILEPHQMFGVDPNRKGVLKMWDFMKKIKYVESDINADSYIDTSIYYDALQELRREKPDPYWENLEKRYHEQNDDQDEIVCH
jgi:NitT/TauT family transport system substrate-binding protein